MEEKNLVHKIKKRKFDIILIAVLVLISAASLLIIELTKESGSYVTVQIDNNITESYSLNKDGEYSINDGTNILVIKGGVAYIRDASCPDMLCVKQGGISNVGERIVCLPNKVIVTVVGEDDSDFLPR